MRKRKWNLIALILALSVLLSGCGAVMTIADLLLRFSGGGPVVSYSDMEYTRPDMEAFRDSLDNACDVAANGKNLDAILDAVYEFYDVYDAFYTNCNLADIRYSADLTDIYWSEEYSYCMEQSPTADAGLDELYRALARSPFRRELESEEYFGAGYFDVYEGESTMDEGFVALMEEEARLTTRYYELSDEALAVEPYSEEYFSTYGPRMAELFVELIRLRQEIAAYVGYDSYPQFAYDYYYYRDYTPDQAVSYLEQMADAFYEPYCRANNSDAWSRVGGYCTESETFAYVKEAAGAMGGAVDEAFGVLEKGGLYDISYGANKYNASFEVYLWSYYEPFIFMNPYLDQTDKLTFAHEFGHFVNDYICYGSYAGTDVAEVHSQAFEYLSLCYCDGTEDLTRYKMANSICTYMENGAYALFEHQVYDLTDDDLTVENVQALYEDIGLRFGFDSWAWDSRDYVSVTHFFTNPMYMMGYVVSNDLAMQIYDLELGEAGAGLSLYEQCLESQESYIVCFAEQYGLESPFAPGRLEKVSAHFKGLFD